MDISLDKMRQCFYSAVVSDALDGLGHPRQSPAARLECLSGQGVLASARKSQCQLGVDLMPFSLSLVGPEVLAHG